MSGIGYVTIGALDSEAAGRFYDAVFGALGSERKLADGGWIGYGAVDAKGEGFMACHTAICPPYNGKPASAGNGTMIAFRAASPDDVKAAYAGGMKNGGTDEGAPGFRPPEATSGFYGAYLRDPTGNKLCIFCAA
jgi:catechol 2,3-dioxygenase-like lactoylglutathione lyase family enzyme